MVSPMSAFGLIELSPDASSKKKIDVAYKARVE
jgi:hypothetical protein